MSAPRTNIETQTRWHRGPLIGIGVVVMFALVLLFWLGVRTAEEGQPAQGETTQIDGRTGAEIEGEPANPTEVPAGDPVPPEPVTPPAEVPPADVPPEEVPNAPPPAPVPDTGTSTP